MNVDTLDNKDVTSITARLASFLNFLKAPGSTSFGGNLAVKGIVTSSLQTHRVVLLFGRFGPTGPNEGSSLPGQ